MDELEKIAGGEGNKHFFTHIFVIKKIRVCKGPELVLAGTTSPSVKKVKSHAVDLISSAAKQ